MSELLPTLQAEDVRDGLVDYLSTTFALADEDARMHSTASYDDPEDGIFKGPYVRLRLPYRPADDGWRSTLEWYEGFTPYGHQAAAFARLSSANLGPEKPRPLPTLVTTGTGSGKTEAFLYPILDHVLRAKREGVGGIKALILYPMNALANDQARRLTDLITTSSTTWRCPRRLVHRTERADPHPRHSGWPHHRPRGHARAKPPDILLTNYKMLDQLLLRPADQALWRQSATSLRYLVLDEFHTYDGAQGTDVAMLLRRLGLALKRHWPAEHPDIDDTARARPLGLITPVATSATLGDKGDPTLMVDFARTVFGERFDDDSIVTETRLTSTNGREMLSPAWRSKESSPGLSTPCLLRSSMNESLPSETHTGMRRRCVRPPLQLCTQPTPPGPHTTSSSMPIPKPFLMRRKVIPLSVLSAMQRPTPPLWGPWPPICSPLGSTRPKRSNNEMMLANAFS